MNLDLSVIHAVLRSCRLRNPSPLEGYNKSEIDENRRLLIEGGFALGAGTADSDRGGRPLPYSYFIFSLTTSGERLLVLLSEEAIWKQTEYAHAEVGSLWSLAELSQYVESLSHDDRKS